MNTKRILARKLIVKQQLRTLTIGVIALLVIVLLVAFLANQMLQARRKDANIVNGVGKQLISNQKLVKQIYVRGLSKDSLAISKGDDSSKNEINGPINFRELKIEVPTSHSPKIDSLVQMITAYQEELISNHLDSVGDINERTNVEALIKLENQFLDGLEEIVDIYENEKENDFLLLTRIIYILTFCSFIFVILGYKYLIKPQINNHQFLLDVLLEENNKLHSILDNTSNLIWTVDEQYRLVAYNTSFTELYHSVHEQYPKAGKYFLKDLARDKKGANLKEWYKKTFSGKSFNVTISEEVQNEVHHFELSFSPVTGNSGEIVGCCVYRRDITSNINMMSDLRQSELSLKEAQEIANMGNWNWDMKEDTVKWSSQLYLIYGKDSMHFDVNIESVKEIIHPEDLEKVGNVIERSIANRSPHDITYRILTSDGNIRYIHQKGIVITDKEGIPIRMAGTAHDVTTLEEANQKIIHQYRELQNFVYIISHNVRSPIATLLGLINILEVDTKDSDYEIIKNIHETVHVLDETIKDLNHSLSLKKIDQSHYCEVNLNEVINEIKVLMAEEIAVNKVTINTYFKDSVVHKGVKSYYANILYNLIMNAINYRSSDREAQIGISAEKLSNGYLKLTISDNGIGMDLNEEREKRIFNMYGRLNGDSQGKGLGLFLVKSQVEALNGTIEVDSVLGEGTVFTVILS